MTLAERGYRLTATFPKDEVYGMTSQIRRAAVSLRPISPKGMAANTADRSFNFFESLRVR